MTKQLKMKKYNNNLLFPLSKGKYPQGKGIISGFSIIEVMVGIFIFTIGLLSIYTVIFSILKVNDFNKNHIIASNLAREQLELIRNIRDSNYKLVQRWDLYDPSTTDYSKVFEVGKYYKIENDFSGGFPISVEKINSFEEGKDKLNGSVMSGYKLCLDSENRYTYDCTTSGNINTPFYKFISIEQAKDSSGDIAGAYKVKSKVIWYKRGYYEFEINTIIADWKRL